MRWKRPLSECSSPFWARRAATSTAGRTSSAPNSRSRAAESTPALVRRPRNQASSCCRSGDNQAVSGAAGSSEVRFQVICGRGAQNMSAAGLDEHAGGVQAQAQVRPSLPVPQVVFGLVSRAREVGDLILIEPG